MYEQRLRPCFVGITIQKTTRPWTELRLSRSKRFKKVAKTLHCKGSWSKRYKRVAKTLHCMGSWFTRWKDWSWPCLCRGSSARKIRG